MFSPSSKSCSSSSRTPLGICSKLPCSNCMPSLNVPACSCWSLMTFSKVVSRTWVSLSKPLTTPVWVVREAAVAKVPVTSLRTKWALNVASGGLDVEYLKPLSVILIDLAAPISVVVAINLVPEPDVVFETLTVGSLV